MRNTIVTLTNVGFSYRNGEFPAIRAANLCLNRGDIALFHGPNGGGKSTLLKLINGLLQPGDGTISSPVVREKMVYLHQEPYVLQGSVRYNIDYPLRLRKMERSLRAERMRTWLDRLGLSALAGNRARALSGGQKQRVCLARAMTAEPEFVLLDEPTAHLDRDTRTLLASVLKEEHARRELTIAIATHDSGFGYGLGTRFFQVQDGDVHEDTVNVLPGSVAGKEGSLIRFQVERGPILLVADTGVETAERIVFRSEDMILSRTAIGGSALNQLELVVTKVTHHDRLCDVTMDAGHPIVARITGKSREILRIESGETVFVALKASALGIY